MELIKITEQNGEQAVSARDLHNFLDIETRFDIWIQRMFEYGFAENVDYERCTFLNFNNQQVTDFALTLDCAKEISMIQRTEKGNQPPHRREQNKNRILRKENFRAQYKDFRN